MGEPQGEGKPYRKDEKKEKGFSLLLFFVSSIE
jgi:hypothetical protein